MPVFLPEGVVRVTGLITALLAAASSKKPASSSSADFIIFLVLIAVVGYFLLIRPQKQRTRRQREQQSNIGVGDEVVTVGGIRGRVVAMDAEHVTIVSGEDTVGFAAAESQPHRLVLVRNAIARKVEPKVDADISTDATEDDEEDEPSSNGYGALDFGDDHAAGNGHDASSEGASAESEGTSP
jgi:preprotein translocase subunit YajC